ncbi:cytochrome c [Defluviimonas sp. WL0024]|uniref:Cytochrome c n=2 Tax=Albidovulum TaxID=205889 RepID=A0ABT3J2D9_9RHOB|nr:MULTISPECIES: cytochrome c [Defluviimonas]MCU9847743.1 cytochrome c [Defluviimonas sp. WL0024]MCW3781828.1 cytochrome c [Defluviimonas salinarum]
MRNLIILGAVVAVGLGYWVFTRSASETGATAGQEAVVMPDLAGELVAGQRGFAAKCASCHGEALTGVEAKGPPLLHPYYEPGHHGDEAFVRAVRQGARAHHWSFGDMAPVEGLTDADIAAITGYVRAVQKANGIF